MDTFELQSEPAATERQHSTSAYTALNPKDQEVVREADAVIFMRWPTPKLSADERTVFAEDLAVLCGEFHGVMMRDAVMYLRQHAQRRPTVAHIRERCDLLREQAKGKQKDAAVLADAEYRRRIQSHPEEFVPIALIIRDVAEYQVIRRKFESEHPGQTIDLMWRADWWEWRNEKTEQEWAEMRAKGVVALGYRQEEKDRYGRPLRAASDLVRAERVA